MFRERDVSPEDLAAPAARSLGETWAAAIYGAARALAPKALLRAVGQGFIVLVEPVPLRRIRIGDRIYGERCLPGDLVWEERWSAPLIECDPARAAARIANWLIRADNGPFPPTPPSPAADPAAVLAEDLDWLRAWNARHNRWYGARIEDAAAVLAVAEEAARAGDPVTAHELRDVVRGVIAEIVISGFGFRVPRKEGKDV